MPLTLSWRCECLALSANSVPVSDAPFGVQRGRGCRASFVGVAEAGTRRDDQILSEIQISKAARAARLAATSEAPASMPIIITPASAMPDVEPIDADAKPTEQKSTETAAATAGEDVDDFASVNPDEPIGDIQVPSDLTEEIDDPLEPVNRVFFGLQ